ncbi:MAG: CHAD domain-containing protein [Candidatus Acidiferrales bacterium]
MNRVLQMADAVQEGWKSKDVHDLRVALRRCRTMADALSEVNPDRGWRKLKKDSRELFRALGALRDTQVEQEWLKRLSAADDPVRRHLLKALAQAESKQQKEAEKALESFDRRNWKKWAQKLGDKAQFFPLESVVFQRLALTRLNEAAELYQRARKGRSRIAWHRLRIGLKGFRYTLENFMPQRYEPWSKNLKRIQDLLGEVHDMDVLRGEIRRQRAKLPEPSVLQWYQKIEEARKTRLEEFRSLIGGNGGGAGSGNANPSAHSGNAGRHSASHPGSSGKESLWQVWRTGFRAIHTVQSSAIAEPQRFQSAS